MAEPFTYYDGDTRCDGAIALPAGDARVPGIAVFADAMGFGEHTRRWADRLATELGYVALAADIYGAGNAPADFNSAVALLTGYKDDRSRLVVRAGAALDALRAQPRCDGRLAAIGFCFGGTTVLELARANYPELVAGVSFHGGLSTPGPTDGAINAKLLACHGAEDPLVNPAELAAFLVEMAAAGADCQTIAYTGAVHSFTNETADGSMMPGIMYNERTAKRSWNAMAVHFAEVLAI